MEGYCSTGQSPQRAVVPVEEEEEEEEEEGRQCTCTVTLWRFSVTGVAMEMQQGEMCVSLSNMEIFKFAQKCLMANLRRSKNETYSGFHVQCPIFLFCPI
jgi:hypothetical protein